jgi:hypothetical protein
MRAGQRDERVDAPRDHVAHRREHGHTHDEQEDGDET